MIQSFIKKSCRRFRGEIGGDEETVGKLIKPVQNKPAKFNRDYPATESKQTGKRQIEKKSQSPVN